MRQMMSLRVYERLQLIAVVFWALCFVSAPAEVGSRPFPMPAVPTPFGSNPFITSFAPTQVVGISGKFLIRGRNLGTAADSVVVFSPGVIATSVEWHTPNEVCVRVPVDARTGWVQVIRGVNADRLRALQTQLEVMGDATASRAVAEISEISSAIGMMLAWGQASNPIQVLVTAAYVEPSRLQKPVIEAGSGSKFVRNRVIVDLRDFLSFDVALQIANQFGADLVGYIPVTNSYILDLRKAPESLHELEAVIKKIEADPRVVEVWKDMVLELRQVRFADVDVVDRYRHNYDANLHGREDVWATDRIQAPGAWNLIERFYNRNDQTGRVALNPVKLCVLDSGCDQTHPEFRGVDLKKVTVARLQVRIAGREVILPDIGRFREDPYDLGDADDETQHGTGVISLIGARNGNPIDAAQGDRGINGLLHNPMPYTIQVYRSGDWREAGDRTTVAAFLSVINAGVITGAKIMNASYGRAGVPAETPEVRIALRKLAHQLKQFQNRLLLCCAAGNMASEVTPFEDFNLNGELDPGEDQDGDGRLDHGNDVAASLGTLPNVIAVGAIGGPDYGLRIPDWARDDQRADFSNWGVPVQLAAPGTDVFVAGGGVLVDSPPSFLIGGARFQRSDGTSFATALVTGSAGLLKAIHPALTPAEIKQRLIASSFLVNTTDGRGAPMRWNTLKTGFAVRQLMVDMRIIGNNQAWTGVSKIVTDHWDGLHILEIRRGAEGRAEGFNFRPLGIGGFRPALRHDGHRVAYQTRDPDGMRLHEFRFDTLQGNTLEGPFIPQSYLAYPLEYNPRNDLLWTFRTTNDYCNWTFAVRVRRADGADNVTIAETRFNACRFDWSSGNPLDWQWYDLYRANWKPDSRVWDLDYRHENGNGNTTREACREWWFDNPYPLGFPLPFPGCSPLREYGLMCWSFDGRARAGFIGDDLVTRYYDSTIRRQVQQVGRGSARWICWSPDGSEMALLSLGESPQELFSLRRDIRDVGDRSPSRIFVFAPFGGWVFSWSW